MMLSPHRLFAETHTGVGRHRGRVTSTFIAVLTLMQMTLSPLPAAAAQQRAASFKLANGLEIVVIPDHRAPVATHMVWYRVGAADELPGVSGIAHFLEHLMFKGTKKIPPGEFSKIVARNGGQDNAFTTQDTTAYFQRVAKDRLPLVMEMEADRMANLALLEKDVLTERDVILEERRMRVDSNPTSIFNEQLMAALYLAHPYRIPVIGWEHEMRKLSHDDAVRHYKKYYAPNNAILIVAGDVEPDEIRGLAEKFYGPLQPNPELTGIRRRPMEPPQIAPRRIEYQDARAGKPMMQRDYIAPSYATAEPGEAETLDLLMKVVGSGATSRIYKKLVIDNKVASSAGGYYSGAGLDLSKISFYAVTKDAADLGKAENLIDEIIADVRANGVSELEIERAKKVYLAEYIQESDSQGTLARRYGWAMTTGQTIKDVEDWPVRIAKVTMADVKRIAAKHFDIRHSVTGQLLPAAAKTDANSGTAPLKADKS